MYVMSVLFALNLCSTQAYQYPFPRISGTLNGETIDIQKSLYYNAGEHFVYNCTKYESDVNRLSVTQETINKYLLISKSTTLSRLTIDIHLSEIDDGTSFNCAHRGVTKTTMLHQRKTDGSKYSGKYPQERFDDDTNDDNGIDFNITLNNEAITLNGDTYVNFNIGDTLKVNCRRYNNFDADFKWIQTQVNNNNDYVIFETESRSDSIKELNMIMNLNTIDNGTELLCQNGGEKIIIPLRFQLKQDGINPLTNNMMTKNKTKNQDFNCNTNNSSVPSGKKGSGAVITANTSSTQYIYISASLAGSDTTYHFFENSEKPRINEESSGLFCFRLKYDIHVDAPEKKNVYTRSKIDYKYFENMIEKVTILENITTTPDSLKDEIKDGIEWKISVGILGVIFILILTIIIVLKVFRNKKLNREKSEDIIYDLPMIKGRKLNIPKSSSNQVVYAALEMAESSRNIVNKEETPYAEIIGVLMKEK